MISEEIYFDDGAGVIHNGTVDYATGLITMNPDSETTFAVADLEWVSTGAGVEEDGSAITSTEKFSRVYNGIKYIPTGTIYAGGDILCKFHSADGASSKEYSRAISPIFPLKIDKTNIEIVPKSLSVKMGADQLIDGGDGKLYIHDDGISGDRLEVGDIDYIDKSFLITSDTIDISDAIVSFCSGTGSIEPVQSIVFRTPGVPVRPGSVFIKATTGTGEVIEGTTDFNGNIIGDGIIGFVDFNTGLCQAIFGEWVADDATAQASNWYNSDVNDGAGNVWKPFVVHAATMLLNCVITSYLPLDKELLGLDPVRLPLDGKVPIFRDGYVVSIHHTETYILLDNPVQTNIPYYVGRKPVGLLEVYDSADDPEEGQEYSDDFPEYVPDGGNYTVDLNEGTVTFLDTFVTAPYRQPFRIVHRIEDMALASDVQITGHISITTPLNNDYPGVGTNPNNPALVSSVLPSGDLQSRAYNEFEQTAWTSEWSDNNIGGQPLSSFNFVDYPITVINQPSIKERWLILFTGPTTISVIGENFGYMAENVTISPSGLSNWSSGLSGSYNVDGIPTLIIASSQFVGEYYWKVPLAGFGTGWQSGNCIRFNQDAANFPLWFIRTTLQAPATKAVDHYTIQIRGDSS